VTSRQPEDVEESQIDSVELTAAGEEDIDFPHFEALSAHLDLVMARSREYKTWIDITLPSKKRVHSDEYQYPNLRISHFLDHAVEKQTVGHRPIWEHAWPETSVKNLLPHWLNTRADAGDAHTLSQITAVLVENGHTDMGRTTLEKWIRTEGFSWAALRRPALGAVIEAAASLSLNDTDRLIEYVLANPESPLLSAAVAAQRARRVYIDGQQRRSDVARHIVGWIEKWQHSAPLQAALAFPSIPELCGYNAADLIASSIIQSTSLVAWGAVTGLHDWLRKSRDRIPQEHSSVFFDTILTRLEDEQMASSFHIRSDGTIEPDLVAALVLLLGQVASEQHLTAAARIIFQAFVAPKRSEDAAAITAGQALVGRHRILAMKAFSSAFVESHEQFMRYVTLLVNQRKRDL